MREEALQVILLQVLLQVGQLINYLKPYIEQDSLHILILGEKFLQ